MRGWIASAVICCACVVASTSAAPPYDIILRHGTVLDGTGAKRVVADVGIAGGRILRIGSLQDDSASIDLDVKGLFVAPGFINIHSHASPAALAKAENMLTQGVTTEIINADGGGRTDLAEQMSSLPQDAIALNVGAYIGFNSVWSAVVGAADRRPTSEDISRMRALVDEGMRSGAWGVSAGLDYKPAYYATADEVSEVVDAAAHWRTNFTNHDRVTPESRFSSHAGIAETLLIGAKSGLLPVVTHMKVTGREQGSAALALSLLTTSASKGHYAAADAYPYLAGQTALGALIVPAWAQDGGRQEMLKRFADPTVRAKIAAESEQALTARFGGAPGVYLPETQQELTDVMRQMDAPAGEAVLRLLEKGNPRAILRFGVENDLVKILQHPTTSIACDCGATTDTRTHPRNYGTYPRVLGRYVRETGALTWEEAVRKMTGLPAATIGLVDRGLLAPGMIADVTVFDPATVIDRATYEEPALLSQGIRHVLVNGRLALRDGAATGEAAGRIIERTGRMPSRPMNGTEVRVLRFDGGLDNTRVLIELVQRDQARAVGTVRILDYDTQMRMELVDPGVLQVAEKWASITGRVRFSPGGQERAALLIIEAEDPLEASHAPTITLQTDGGYTLIGRLHASSFRPLQILREGAPARPPSREEQP